VLAEGYMSIHLSSTNWQTCFTSLLLCG